MGAGRSKKAFAAAAAGDEAAVREALAAADRKGRLPDVNWKNDEQGDRTALHAAAGAGASGVVALLLERGAEVDARSRKGWTPLHMAAREGHADACRLLLAAGADPRAAGDEGAWTVLHNAAFAGRLEACELLLAAGASANARDGRGHSPLYYAEERGHVNVASVLRVSLKAV